MRSFLAKLSRRRAALPSAVFVVGVLLVSVGVGLVFVPAGLIVAGVVASVSSVFYERGVR